MYGKQTESAIAALSRLAEVYDGGRTRLSAGDIARHRGLQAPSVAKLLTLLSQAGLVDGTPGPGGGYTLARPPAKISLLDVYDLFEREESPRGELPRAVQRRLVSVRTALDDLLRNTTLDDFRDETGHGRARESAAAAQPRRRRRQRMTRAGGAGSD